LDLLKFIELKNNALNTILISDGKKGFEVTQHFYFRSGELAEWSIALVLKTSVPQGTESSNLSLSAEIKSFAQKARDFFLILNPCFALTFSKVRA
jgi:hypothetical protein